MWGTTSRRPSRFTHNRNADACHPNIYQKRLLCVLPHTPNTLDARATMSSPLEVKKAHKIDSTSFPYIFEENAEVPLKTSSQGIVRVNVYRPKSTDEGKQLPVLVTYGPYGKDIHYKE